MKVARFIHCVEENKNQGNTFVFVKYFLLQLYLLTFASCELVCWDRTSIRCHSVIECCDMCRSSWQLID